jgi:hypothetical protein
MTELNLEFELAALRERRAPSPIVVWLRGHRPFDRRSIREPDERDAYWARVQQRLAESDAASLSRRATEPPTPAPFSAELIG